jgi:hypothetical protein
MTLLTDSKMTRPTTGACSRRSLSHTAAAQKSRKGGGDAGRRRLLAGWATAGEEGFVQRGRAVTRMELLCSWSVKLATHSCPGGDAVRAALGGAWQRSRGRPAGLLPACLNATSSVRRATMRPCEDAHLHACARSARPPPAAAAAGSGAAVRRHTQLGPVVRRHAPPLSEPRPLSSPCLLAPPSSVAHGAWSADRQHRVRLIEKACQQKLVAGGLAVGTLAMPWHSSPLTRRLPNWPQVCLQRRSTPTSAWSSTSTSHKGEVVVLHRLLPVSRSSLLELLIGQVFAPHCATAAYTHLIQSDYAIHAKYWALSQQFHLHSSVGHRTKDRIQPGKTTPYPFSSLRLLFSL